MPTIFAKALVIQRNLDDQDRIAFTLATLGYIANRSGKREKAIHLWKQSLAIAEEIHIPLESQIRSWLDGTSPS
jgi:hypothetical protein